FSLLLEALDHSGPCRVGAEGRPPYLLGDQHEQDQPAKRLQQAQELQSPGSRGLIHRALSRSPTPRLVADLCDRLGEEAPVILLPLADARPRPARPAPPRATSGWPPPRRHRIPGAPIRPGPGRRRTRPPRPVASTLTHEEALRDFGQVILGPDCSRPASIARSVAQSP